MHSCCSLDTKISWKVCHCQNIVIQKESSIWPLTCQDFLCVLISDPGCAVLTVSMCLCFFRCGILTAFFFCPEINCPVDCRFSQSTEMFLNIYRYVSFDCFLFGCQGTTQCLESSSVPCTNCHGLHNLSHAPFSKNIALGVEVCASSL